jgi:hypothetical protein
MLSRLLSSEVEDLVQVVVSLIIRYAKDVPRIGLRKLFLVSPSFCVSFVFSVCHTYILLGAIAKDIEVGNLRQLHRQKGQGMPGSPAPWIRSGLKMNVVGASVWLKTQTSCPEMGFPLANSTHE